MWTVSLAPAAKLLPLVVSDSVSWPTAPVIWNQGLDCPPVVDCETIDQSRSTPAGRGSLRPRPVAFPVPVFLMVMVKPAAVPAVIEVLSAVLVKVRLAPR